MKSMGLSSGKNKKTTAKKNGLVSPMLASPSSTFTDAAKDDFSVGTWRARGGPETGKSSPAATFRIKFISLNWFLTKLIQLIHQLNRISNQKRKKIIDHK